MSIDERPEIADEKSRVGDWEIDTMIGKGHSGVLVTIVERKTNFTVAAQVNSKSAAEVTLSYWRLLKIGCIPLQPITARNLPTLIKSLKH